MVLSLWCHSSGGALLLRVSHLLGLSGSAALWASVLFLFRLRCGSRMESAIPVTFVAFYVFSSACVRPC